MARALSALRGTSNLAPLAAGLEIDSRRNTCIRAVAARTSLLADVSLVVRCNSIVASFDEIPGPPENIDDLGEVGAALCNCQDVGA
jgi:hypothetical protein